MSLLTTSTNASINGWKSISSNQIYNIGGTMQQVPTGTNQEFGNQIALSGDGNRCAVSTWFTVSGTNNRYVYVFIKNIDGTWSQEATLTFDSVYSFEHPLVMNYDGSVVVLSKGSSSTPMEIYTRTGTSWSLSQSIATNATSLAISPDGLTIVVGNSTFNSSRGRVLIYTKSGSTWALTGSVAPRATLIVGANFGYSVAISNDGHYIAVGCTGFSNTSPEARVFIFLDEVEQATITPLVSNNNATAEMVSLDNTGTYMCFTNRPGGLQNRVYVYKRTSTTWSLNATLYGNNTPSGEDFANGLDMDSDANTIVVGARDTTVNSIANAGTVYVFNRIGTSWYNSQNLNTVPLQANAFAGGKYSGTNISFDGSLIAFGASGMNILPYTNAGKVFTYNLT
jgi:hypothetical protein